MDSANASGHLIRYVIAQFLPDPIRLEPRNIGIIAWTENGGFCTRFFGDGAGQAQLRRIPSFVTDKYAFKEWVKFWRRTILQANASDKIARDMSLESVPPIIAFIIEKSRRHFRLAANGLIVGSIKEADVETAVDELFAKLVDSEPAVHSDYPRLLQDACESAMEEVGLRRSDYFFPNQGIHAKLASGQQTLYTFDYVFKNGHPIRIYDRCSPKSGHSETKAFRFQRVAANQEIEQSDLVAVVYVDDEDNATEETLQGLETLRSEARVLNVAKRDAGLEEFDKLRSELERLRA